MNTLFNLVVVVQVLSALAIIGLVLLQHGKGADMGAAFGSGASGSLFGATGSSNFMSKSTGVAAAVFFGATLGLAYFAKGHTAVNGGLMDRAAVTAPAPVTGSAAIPTAAPVVTPAAPAAPAAAPAPAPAPATPAADAAAPAAAPANVPVTPANQLPK
ncbi:preprotein translocase subunit SecG [Massilia aquatica]|uniref:Protein-export membrane protein SecG n=1 Tax=Massilia aquatica TaxID=2609000 RepID=A0ABX0M440_9BURK|nr:preprotein translocase subunit SecG [Massilia aquatica]NHZ41378.1 preprotein translocase subunit SecG [Massilia aquatica]